MIRVYVKYILARRLFGGFSPIYPLFQKTIPVVGNVLVVLLQKPNDLAAQKQQRDEARSAKKPLARITHCKRSSKNGSDKILSIADTYSFVKS